MSSGTALCARSAALLSLVRVMVPVRESASKDTPSSSRSVATTVYSNTSLVVVLSVEL